MKANVNDRQCTTGRKPQPAEPTAMPVMAASEIGMRLTRSGPCSASSAGDGEVDIVYTRESRRISSATAESRAAAKLIFVTSCPPCSPREANDYPLWVE